MSGAPAILYPRPEWADNGATRQLTTDHPRWGWLAAGLASPTVLLLTVATGAIASPAFDWPTDPFSLIGTTATPTATLFNAGLAVAGLAALPFAVHLWRNWHRAVGGLYGLVGGSLVGAAVFPAAEGAVLHEVFGAGVLLGMLALLWVAAVLDWRAGHRRAAAGAAGLGAASLAVWLPYDLGAAWAQVGYGAAELGSFLAFAAWSAWTVARRRAGTGPTSTRGTQAADDHEGLPP